MAMFLEDYLKLMGQRFKALRLERGYTQQEMCKRAGIKFATYQIFERTGKISLGRFYKIASVIHRQQELEELFKPLPIQSIAQLVEVRQRQRGRRRVK